MSNCEKEMYRPLVRDYSDGDVADVVDRRRIHVRNWRRIHLAN